MGLKSSAATNELAILDMVRIKIGREACYIAGVITRQSAQRYFTLKDMNGIGIEGHYAKSKCHTRQCPSCPPQQEVQAQRPNSTTRSYSHIPKRAPLWSSKNRP